MSNTLETTGIVETVFGNNNFRVRIEVEGKTTDLPCHLSGKMRQFKISVIPGDEVTVVIPPPYDKGRIIYRGKKV